jgi:hypothetical protein
MNVVGLLCRFDPLGSDRMRLFVTRAVNDEVLTVPIWTAAVVGLEGICVAGDMNPVHVEVPGRPYACDVAVKRRRVLGAHGGG